MICMTGCQRNFVRSEGVQYSTYTFNVTSNLFILTLGKPIFYVRTDYCILLCPSVHHKLTDRLTFVKASALKNSLCVIKLNFPLL